MFRPGSPRTDGDVLRAAVEATRLLIVVVGSDGTVRDVNRAVEGATGLSAEACTRPIWELATIAEERARLQAAFTPLRAEALPSGLLFHLVTTDGPPRVIDWDVRLIHQDGAAAYVVLAGVDLTERLAAEKRLREPDALLRFVLDELPSVIWATDERLRFTLSAGRDVAALGLETNQVAILGTSLWSYFQTTDPTHPAIAPHLQALEGKTTTFEMPWHDRVFQARVAPWIEPDGSIVGCIGFAVDVTEQREAARAVRESDARLRRLLESNLIGITLWGANGVISEANDAFLHLFGYTRDDLRSGTLSWREMTAPDHRERGERALADVLATGTSAPFELEGIAKDGSRVPVLVGSASFGRAPDGSRTGVAFVLDLREQVRLRKMRDQLLVEEQKARLDTEIANARLLMLVEGSKRLSRAMKLNDTLDTLATLVVPGLADWSFVIHRGWDGGPSFVSFAHGDPNKRELLRRLRDCAPDLDAPEGAPRVFRTGEVALYEDITMEQLTPTPPAWAPVGTRDPEHLHLLRAIGMRSMLCVPIPGRVGVDAVLMLVSATDPHRYAPEDVVLARDLAQRAATSLENARLLAEALESVRARDEFLAVAAHELRTPLTSLLLQLQLLARTVDGDREKVQRGLEAAERHAKRLAALVERLLDVSRLASNPLSMRLEDVDAVQMVRQVVATLAPDLQRAGCAVQIVAPAQVTGRWDRLRLEQVLTNLLANAMKFGTGRPIEVNIEATPTNARISVRDQGIGVSPHDHSRIFGRFERAVSTRHYGGLGLGLYISAQIVRAHQGYLHVESEPGKGACFTMVIPRLPAATAAGDAIAAAAPGART